MLLEVVMNGLRKFATGAAIVGALGMGALGVGTATAAAAAPSAPFAEDPGWGHGHGDDWRWDNGRHRGWDYGPGIYLPCVTGPFGHVTVCP
ncbi:hypothetical protein C1S82_04715 [Mycolicibacterium cosmeticum]|nr:hypothetical protein [Mycolicibacterium cosmeticum]TLH80203.1 hypothetical protein C1S82_04715 [Mycolicibacterium cosmeticum]